MPEQRNRDGRHAYLRLGEQPMLRLSVIAACLVAAISGAAAQDKTATAISPRCFWCVEADFDKVAACSRRPPVTSRFGEEPDLQAKSRRRTGHAEAVKVVYDPPR